MRNQRTEAIKWIQQARERLAITATRLENYEKYLEDCPPCLVSEELSFAVMAAGGVVDGMRLDRAVRIGAMQEPKDDEST